ncbi:hypothetical protein SKAU_G00430640 [Synaphobranchus kaupii]|uniref:Uncharacterized protein n=1 Tax=Synaphobranchus kaupii TaxID=118154 RepID=A0A9Q1E490_SYNKA|nr:hypothetical protein SKAU_G00430640 [Synaphobranchus kaupii]
MKDETRPSATGAHSAGTPRTHPKRQIPRAERAAKSVTATVPFTPLSFTPSPTPERGTIEHTPSPECVPTRLQAEIDRVKRGRTFARPYPQQILRSRRTALRNGTQAEIAALERRSEVSQNRIPKCRQADLAHLEAQSAERWLRSRNEP